MPLKDGRYTGPLYRALNPAYARAPLSGQGTALSGGRFNARGTPALYTALDPAGALREASQVGSLQPVVLVSYRADLGPIFDARDVSALLQRGMSDHALASPSWRTRTPGRSQSPTQRFARDLVAEGFAGLLARSFARGVGRTDFNIVLWRWSGRDCALDVVENDNRLSKMWRVTRG